MKCTKAIDRLEKRGVEKGSGQRSTLKGRGRATANQTNIATVSKATLGRLLKRRGWSAYGLSRVLRYHPELNLTELIRKHLVFHHTWLAEKYKRRDTTVPYFATTNREVKEKRHN